MLGRKTIFYGELKCERDVHNAGEFVVYLGYFNEHVSRHIDGFGGAHKGYSVGQRNLEGIMLYEFCLEKELCVSNTWCEKEEKRKVIFRMGENGTKIDFVL